MCWLAARALVGILLERRIATLSNHKGEAEQQGFRGSVTVFGFTRMPDLGGRAAVPCSGIHVPRGTRVCVRNRGHGR